MAGLNWIVAAGLTVSFLSQAPALAQWQGCLPEEIARLLGLPPITPFTFLGYSADIDGDRMVMGKPGTGKLVVFVRDINGVWIPTDIIEDPQDDDFSGFGIALDLYEDTLIVGAPFSFNGFDGAGAAYVYKEIGGEWVLVKTLTSDSPEVEENFGTSVSGYAEVGWEAVVVGAPNDGPISQGSAYVFQPDQAGDLVLAEKLEGDVTFGQLGTSVDVCGPWLIAGAPTVGGIGYANIYQSDGNGNWSLEAAFTGTFEREFGRDVAIGISVHGEVAAIGEPLGELDNGFPAGRVHIAEYDGVTWSIADELFDGSLTPGDRFGWSVDFNDTFDLLSISAPSFDENVFDEGKAYVFQSDDAGNFIEVAQVQASDGASGDSFGWDVAVDDDTLVVGAPLHDGDGLMDTGSGYVFQLNCGGGNECYADFDGNGQLNILDFVAFQNAFSAQDPNADCDENGSLNILDFICFGDAFNAGC